MKKNQITSGGGDFFDSHCRSDCADCWSQVTVSRDRQNTVTLLITT